MQIRTFAVKAALASFVAAIPAHQEFKAPDVVDDGVAPQPGILEVYGSDVHNATSHDKRGNTAGVYRCTGRNWSDWCRYTVSSGGACHNNAQGLAGNILAGSFGPDHGIRCDLFMEMDCQDAGAMSTIRNVRYPGFSTDANANGYYASGVYLMRSWRCGWI